MACRYIKTCPSATGWCEGSKSKPDVSCINYVLTAYENMKDSMTGNEYQKLAARTINKNLDNTAQKLRALHGMVGGIGEIHSKKELGDLLWFIAEYCTAMGWKLEDIMKLNIDAEYSSHRAEGGNEYE